MNLKILSIVIYIDLEWNQTDFNERLSVSTQNKSDHFANSPEEEHYRVKYIPWHLCSLYYFFYIYITYLLKPTHVKTKSVIAITANKTTQISQKWTETTWGNVYSNCFFLTVRLLCLCSVSVHTFRYGLLCSIIVYNVHRTQCEHRTFSLVRSTTTAKAPRHFRVYIYCYDTVL